MFAFLSRSHGPSRTRRSVNAFSSSMAKGVFTILLSPSLQLSVTALVHDYLNRFKPQGKLCVGCSRVVNNANHYSVHRRCTNKTVNFGQCCKYYTSLRLLSGYSLNCRVHAHFSSYIAQLSALACPVVGAHTHTHTQNVFRCECSASLYVCSHVNTHTPTQSVCRFFPGNFSKGLLAA